MTGPRRPVSARPQAMLLLPMLVVRLEGSAAGHRHGSLYLGVNGSGACWNVPSTDSRKVLEALRTVLQTFQKLSGGRKESGSFREHSMNNETRVSAGSCSSPGVRGSFRKILRTFQESAEETFQLPEPSSCLWQAVRRCPGVTPQGGATMGAEWGRAEKVVGRSFYDSSIMICDAGWFA